MSDTSIPGPEKGLIFDIQGYSVHDGPGCRTLVFLSGCPLSCPWCANPEGQLLRPRLLYRRRKCTHQNFRCLSACPHEAITRTSSGTPLRIDHQLCDQCSDMKCVDACYSEALHVSGSWYGVEKLMRILRRDREYWGARGGVTFSGGEPLLQSAFLTEVLKLCRREYIHTAVETTCHAPKARLDEVLKWTDWLFVDLKHMDTLRHREFTSVGNEKILANLRSIRASDWPGRLILRVTVVPGFNDSEENMEATARFAAAEGIGEINLLPFHAMATSKYEQLGRAYAYDSQPAPAPVEMQRFQTIFESHGLHCYVDSQTPF